MLTAKRIREIKARVDIPEVNELLAEIKTLQAELAKARKVERATGGKPAGTLPDAPERTQA